MHCGNCTNAVETALRAVDGVKSATADLKSQTVRVIVNAAAADMPDALIEAIEDAGFESHVGSAAGDCGSKGKACSAGGSCSCKGGCKCGDNCQCSDCPGDSTSGQRNYYNIAILVGAVALAALVAFRR